MPTKAARDKKPVKLDEAKVFQFDPDVGSRIVLAALLKEIGFRNVEDCNNIGGLKEGLWTEPDLLFIDIDTDREAACAAMQEIRTSKLGPNPFVVIVALTAKPELASIEAALKSGADDMIAKPVTARALRERVTNQIHNRKEFIATDKYVGPDRRPDEGELSADDVPAIVVPNTLRHSATGDKSAALDPERVKETLQSLSMQKLYHLSRDIGQIAGELKTQVKSKPGEPLPAEGLDRIPPLLSVIEEIIGEQSFDSVRAIVASTHKALDDAKAAGDKISPDMLELLRLQGLAIGAVLRESGEAVGVLVSALDVAVSVVGKRSRSAA